MDYQTLINIGASAGLSVLGWFARVLWTAAAELRADLARLREELPKTYVTKDDFKDALREVRELLERIDRKLDMKQDKA